MTKVEAITKAIRMDDEESGYEEVRAALLDIRKAEDIDEEQMTKEFSAAWFDTLSATDRRHLLELFCLGLLSLFKEMAAFHLVEEGR